MIEAALKQRGLGVRTLARLRVAETHPEPMAARERDHKIELCRRQIHKWIKRPGGRGPVEYLEPENATWVARLLAIPAEDLLKPELSRAEHLEWQAYRLLEQARAARLREPDGER